MWVLQLQDTLVQHEKLYSDELGTFKNTQAVHICASDHMIATSALLGYTAHHWSPLSIPLWVTFLSSTTLLQRILQIHILKQRPVSLFHGKVLHLLENLCVSTISHSWKSAAVFIWFVLIRHSESPWFFVQNSIFSLVPWHSLFDLYSRVMISKLYVVSIQQSLTYYNPSLQICRAGVGLL